MKKLLLSGIILTLLLSVASLYNPKGGLKKFNYELKDGDKLSLESIINPHNGKQPFFIIPENDKTLIKKSSLTLFNSAIIRSFENDSNNFMDLITYANHISANRNMDYWNLRPYIYYAKTPNKSFIYKNVKPKIHDTNTDKDYFSTTISDPRYAFFKESTGYDWKKYEGFNHYYHKLFKSQTARKLLFEQALNVVYSLCNSYPSDFKKSVLLELDQLLIFTQSLKSGRTISNTDDLNDYWKGFIYRRYKIDNIPLSEIENSIINAQSKIQSSDVKQNPEALYEISINNQVTLLYSIQKVTIYSKSSDKEIIFNYDIIIDDIKYFKDDTGEYYQLNCIKSSVPETYLFDKNLVRIN